MLFIRNNLQATILQGIFLLWNACLNIFCYLFWRASLHRLKSIREHTISGAILSSVRRVKYVPNVCWEETRSGVQQKVCSDLSGETKQKIQCDLTPVHILLLFRLIINLEELKRQLFSINISFYEILRQASDPWF